MSLPGQEGAERKSWRTADLVESLLLFLDARSTLTLVKVLLLALDIIQMKSMWIKLVKRVCPYDTQDAVSEQEFLEGLAAEKMMSFAKGSLLFPETTWLGRAGASGRMGR